MTKHIEPEPILGHLPPVLQQLAGAVMQSTVDATKPHKRVETDCRCPARRDHGITAQDPHPDHDLAGRELIDGATVDETIPAAHHRIVWTISGIGLIEGKPECLAPHGAFCRLSCAEKGCDQEDYPCSHFDEHDNQVWHRLHDSGECNVMAYWEDELLTEIYKPAGGYGAPAMPLTGGPIEVEWDGDQYLWRYPAEGGAE